MVTREQNYKQKKRLGSVRQLVEEYTGFTTGGVRAWLFADTDGFRSECAIKIGAKVLIDFDAVDEWIKAHREMAS
jgi:hypothetical protein